MARQEPERASAASTLRTVPMAEEVIDLCDSSDDDVAPAQRQQAYDDEVQVVDPVEKTPAAKEARDVELDSDEELVLVEETGDVRRTVGSKMTSDLRQRWPLTLRRMVRRSRYGTSRIQEQTV